MRGEHPPYCTCKECTKKRLGKFLGQKPEKRRKDPRETKPVVPQKTKPLRTQATAPIRFLRKIWRKIPLSIHKLFLSLIVIAGLVDIIRRGYLLFTQRTDPIRNTVIFLVELGLWLWIVVILRSRRYKYRQPKLKLVFITVIAITLVCAFAGIEPLSSYKDEVFNSITDYLEERQAIREAAEIAEAEKLATEEEARIESEALAKAEAERKAEEEAKAKEERIIQETLKAERLAFELINKERMLNGCMPTV